MPSTRIGIRDAKIHLSRYLKLVQNGEEIVITDRGRPIGKIVPMTRSDLRLEDRIERLIEKGVLEPATGRRMKAVPPPIPVPRSAAQKMLQEDRDA